MLIGLGTILNIVGIIIGAIIGKYLGNRFATKTRDLIMDILGAVTLISAASAIGALWNQDLLNDLPSGAPILILLASLLLGGLLGVALKIEDRLDSLGETLKARFTSANPRKSENHFVEGFVSSTLIFGIGPLAILGSLSDGMRTGIDQLLLKSTLDFFAAIPFAASFGIGVAFSALPVGIYQGIWTVLGYFLGEVLTNSQTLMMTATGGVLLLGIALKLLRIKNIAIGNLLPSLAFAPLLVFALGHL